MTTTVSAPDKGANAAKTRGDNAHAEPIKFNKRIGSTTFVVAIHFNQSGRETMRDKILKLIESEVRHSA